MIRPLVILHYSLQMFLINTLVYKYHVYLIFLGIVLHYFFNKVFSTKIRYLIGDILIFVILKYPFLYYIGYGYILSNTYTSTSNLLLTQDISSIIYKLELVSYIISYIFNIHYYLIILFTILDMCIIYFLIKPSWEYSKLKDKLESVNYLIIEDYNSRKKEYTELIKISKKEEGDKELNKIENKDLIKIENNIKIDRLHNKRSTINTKISIDTLIPLVLCNRSIYTLILLIVSLLPIYRIKLSPFIFIFLYFLNMKYLSVIACGITHKEKGGVYVRFIWIAILYYIYNTIIP